MIPPLIRRCPVCKHVGRAGTFTVVGDDHRRLECPACHEQFVALATPVHN